MPMRRLPPLHALRAFEACARRLSFKDAAGELSVTPGAVSQQIKALEEDLGVSLFHRKPREVVLTEAGRLLQPQVTESFIRLHEAVERIRPSPRKTLRINTLGSVIVIWLMPRLHRFSDQHPELDTRIEGEVAINPLDEDGPDVVIRYGSEPPDTVYSRKLFDEFLLPLASPKLLEGLKIREPKDVPRARLLSEGGLTLLRGRSEWETWFELVGMQMPQNAQVLSFDGMAGDFVIHAAIEGNGLALGRAFLAHGALRDGQLICPFGPVVPTETSYYVACRKGREDEAHIRAFMDWLQEETAIMSTLHALKIAAG